MNPSFDSKSNMPSSSTSSSSNSGCLVGIFSHAAEMVKGWLSSRPKAPLHPLNFPITDLRVPDLSRCPSDFAKICAALFEKTTQPIGELEHRTKLSIGEILLALEQEHATWGEDFKFILKYLDGGEVQILRVNEIFAPGSEKREVLSQALNGSRLCFCAIEISLRASRPPYSRFAQLIRYTGLHRGHIQPSLEP